MFDLLLVDKVILAESQSIQSEWLTLSDVGSLHVI